MALTGKISLCQTMKFTLYTSEKTVYYKGMPVNSSLSWNPKYSPITSFFLSKQLCTKCKFHSACEAEQKSSKLGFGPLSI